MRKSLFALLVITACASLTTEERISELRKAQRNGNAEGPQFENSLLREHWLKYRSAKKEEAEGSLARACTAYQQLADNPAFSLRELAKWRALFVCPAKDKWVKKQTLTSVPAQHWLHELSTEARLTQARQRRDSKEIMNLQFERSKFLTLPHLKIQAMDEAMKIARSLGDSAKVAEYQKRLEMLAPRRIPKPTLTQWLEVANDFKKARNFDQALNYYQLYFKSKKTSALEKYKALDGIRSVYRLERLENVEPYLEATEKQAAYAAKFFKKKKTRKLWIKNYHDSHVQWARALWTESKRAEAEKILKDAATQLKGLYSRSQIYWILGRIEQEKHDYERSLYWFARSGDEPALTAELEYDLNWDLGWTQRKLKKLRESVETFARFEKKSKTLQARFRFWRAKSLLDMGEEREGRRLLSSLIEDDALGFYGALAVRELKQNFTRLITGVVNPSLQENGQELLRELTNATDLEQVEWLLSLDEKELARGKIKDLRFKNGRSKASHKALAEFFSYYARAGDYPSLYSQFGIISQKAQRYMLAATPELLFPQPHYELTHDHARKHDIKQELIYSIMRQESGFNSEARSPADAFGLMQILPGVARQVAKRHGLELRSDEDLYRPDKNIPIGAALLGDLFKRYKNQFVLSVGSYNAAEDVVANWVVTRYQGDPLEFIEDIPYRETQSYVKLVMRNFIFYSRLNSPQPEMPFPESCLENIHLFKE